MAKKDTAEAVLGMLSSTGASTRPTRTPAEPTPIAEQPSPAHIDDAAAEELELAVSAAGASRRRPAAPARRRGDSAPNAAASSVNGRSTARRVARGQA